MLFKTDRRFGVFHYQIPLKIENPPWCAVLMGSVASLIRCKDRILTSDSDKTTSSNSASSWYSTLTTAGRFMNKSDILLSIIPMVIEKGKLFGFPFVSIAVRCGSGTTQAVSAVQALVTGAAAHGDVSADIAGRRVALHLAHVVLHVFGTGFQ